MFPDKWQSLYLWTQSSKSQQPSLRKNDFAVQGKLWEGKFNTVTMGVPAGKQNKQITRCQWRFTTEYFPHINQVYSQ